MRLINAETFEFKTFFGTSIPKYAILSHRWGCEEEEVSHKQLRKGLAPPNLPGMVKIREFCRLAKNGGFEWAWIDTCCIDKRSSAELSEAINSMYKWYQQSGICYVHLADVEFSDGELSLKRQSEEAFWHAPQGWSSLRDRFGKSSWFKRGWTLQELIAPGEVVFYDSRWNEIGHLRQIREDVANVTKISIRCLGSDDKELLRGQSVATRMSWASRRETSREEDMAYCLLGIFDVDMPLLYGEGAVKAFHRLQTEIMKISDDESLFAWTSDQTHSGLLASQPSYFADSENIVKCSSPDMSRPPFSMTHKGLEIALPKKHLKSFFQNPGRFFLRCYKADSTLPDKALYVELGFMFEPNCAMRINCWTLKESSTYLLSQLDEDLKDNERIYIHTR